MALATGSLGCSTTTRTASGPLTVPPQPPADDTADRRRLDSSRTRCPARDVPAVIRHPVSQGRHTTRVASPPHHSHQERTSHAYRHRTCHSRSVHTPVATAAGPGLHPGRLCRPRRRVVASLLGSGG